MIRNPQVKFEGHGSREYLFPKYPGKFFIQAQKLRELKALKNYMPHKMQKEVKVDNDFFKDDYKELKAQADYIKRIQDLKRKLQKQIKKYNNEKKHNQDMVKNLSISLDQRSSMIKLEEICVNMRYEKDRQQGLNPQKRQSKSLQNRQYHKNVHPIKYQLKNKTEMKRKSKTEVAQMFELKHISYVIETPQYFTNKTERLNNSQTLKLPSIDRSKAFFEGRYSSHKLSQNRLSLPNSIDKISSSVGLSPQNIAQREGDLMVNDYSEKQVQKRAGGKFMSNLSEKYVARKDKKAKFLEFGKKKKETQTFLDGWEIVPDLKNFNDTDSIY